MKILICLAVALCFKSSATHESLETSTVVVTSPPPTEETEPPEDVLVKAINSFGYRLMKTMMKHSEFQQNIVISPTGVAGLLAMALLGSAGTTYDEISQLIGFSKDILANRESHEGFGSRLQALSVNDTQEQTLYANDTQTQTLYANDTQTQTLYANVVLVDQRSKLRDVYRHYLQRVYHADALEARFADRDASKQIINEWVKSHTGNKIEEFLQEPLPISTKVVLLSALYFRGQWARPFLPEHTRLLPFKTPTKEIMIDLMANFGEFDYIFSLEDGVQIISFPYNDTVTKMYVVKPRFPKRLNISEMIDNLDYDKIDNLISHMSKKKCVVRFPKMELENKVDLKESLKALGATSMFTPGEANFAIMLESNGTSNASEEELITRINTGEVEPKTLKDLVDRFVNPGVHVDSVMHEVKINVDEYGTEAVAATSAVMARTAEMFYTDTPFYMFIRNERTKLVTFSALVFDPTA